MEDIATTAVLMDGTADLADLVRELRAEVAGLQREVERLRRENLELRQEAGYWRGQHARAVERIKHLEEEVQQLQAKNRQLQQQAFGRKTEKRTRKDADFLAELEDQGESGSGPKRRGQRRDRPGPGRRNYDHLPAQEEFIELSADQCSCPRCGLAYAQRADTEDAEQIEIDVRAYRRVWRRRRYQPTCSCSGPWQLVTAPAPGKLIPKSRYGVSVWVEILLDKYASHRPTERLLEQWRHLGLDLAAGTVTGGLQRLAALFAPLYEALIARQQEAGYWQADETRWQVFVEQEGKVGHGWWLWVFLSADTAVFVLDVSRSRRTPQNHLPQDETVAGVMMVDRYSAYKAMLQVQDGRVRLAFCWAHVRRDFIRVGKGWPELKDWALDWLRRIRDLYRRQHERLPGPEQTKAAVAEADQSLRQHVQQMQRQAEAEIATEWLRTPCRKVLTSLQEHWEGLTLFVDDPRIPLDNNAGERQLRGPVLGRKNYYGSGAVWSGRLAAMMFSLLATLERCRINPRDWLTGYLQACAAAGGRPPPDLETWLPWRYASQKKSLASPLATA